MITRTQEGQPNPAGQAVNGKASGTLLTVTGDRAKIEGKFEIADSLQIECEIGGELEVGGRLIIGQRGVVRADVKTVDALIMGTYEGNLVATGNVEIASTGRATGNLQTNSLVIEKGGFFNGNVQKIEKPVEKAPEKRAEPAAAATTGRKGAAPEAYSTAADDTEGSADTSYTRPTTTTRSDTRFFTNTAEQPDATP
jgi:cytoskeletal protein CcmA (bactofilin family)